MTISKRMEHEINQKLQILMGLVDMALLSEDDPHQLRAYLTSAKKVIRDTSVFLHDNVERKGDLGKNV
jgi:hypothetical protein